MWLLLAITCLIQQTVTSEQFRSGRHLNPQAFMTIPQIIQYWGYPNEEYEVLTKDGYYLKANRIPYGIHCPEKIGTKPVVLLVHGLLAEGRCWIANLPSNSLGFFLADAGYDVWIINTRGSSWSRRHQTFSIDQQEFWEFSFHEIAIYDIPATIDFILNKTKQEKLYYIGHSQGGTLGFITFSVIPELAPKVSFYFSLAPGYTLVNSKGLFYMLVALPDGLRQGEIGKKISLIRTSNRFIPSTPYKGHFIVPLNSLEKLIVGSRWRNLPGNIVKFLWRESRADVYLGIFPDFSSVKAVTHWSQVTHSHKFRYFDYGHKNEVVYNMTTPPFYIIEEMFVPTAVWSGENDIMEDVTDIQLLLPRIPHLAFYNHISNWQHLDFIFGLDAPKRLYPDILYLMQKYK